VFQDNTCYSSCGIFAGYNINILFNASSKFEGNRAEGGGSSISAFNSSNLEFLGTAVFQNNTCNSGCGILAVHNSKVLLSANAIFEENEANAFGGAVFTSSSTMKLTARQHFTTIGQHKVVHCTLLQKILQPYF